VTEYNGQGLRQTSYAVAGGEVLAQQTGADTASPHLAWRHTNPVTGDLRETDLTGRLTRETHLDPGGADVGTADPFAAGDSGGSDISVEASQAAIDRMLATVIAGYGRGLRCKVDGFVTGCRFAFRVAESGAGVIVRGDAPSGKFMRFINHSTGEVLTRWAPLTVTPNGFVGYLPVGAGSVHGDGQWGINLGTATEKKGAEGRLMPVTEFLNAAFSGLGLGLEPQNTLGIRVPEDIRCPPTGEQLANSRVIQRALRRAWRDSGYGTPQTHEEGGWIYQNPFTGRIATIRATSTGQAHIDLRNPPQMPSFNLIGNFHTHPNPTSEGWDPNPSGDDVRLEFRRNVPGVILSDQGFHRYGPNRWGSNPERADPPSAVPGYPGNAVNTKQNCP
jgi:hypothetical protein